MDVNVEVDLNDSLLNVGVGKALLRGNAWVIMETINSSITFNAEDAEDLLQHFEGFAERIKTFIETRKDYDG